MTTINKSSSTRMHTLAAALGLFVLALMPRIVWLQYFVTADEAKWVYRSAQFLSALLRGDVGGTAVNLTPAVTTTWLGSLGLGAYYWQHKTRIGLPFIEWLNSLPPFRAELPVLAATRWSMGLFTALAVVLIYLLARRLWGPWPALLGAGLIALDPHTLALSRIIGHDAPVTMFVALSLLALLISSKADGPQPTPLNRWLVVSGVMGGLAYLSKSPALFLVPFMGLVLLAKTWPGWRAFLSAFLVWCLSAYLAVFVFWPAVWIAPIRQPLAVVENAFLSATNADEAAAGEGPEEDTVWLIPDLGPFYYLVNGAFKLSPLVMIGLLIGLVLALKTSGRSWPNQDAFWLGLFALLFLIFMTLGGKRSNRYILPIFPPLALLAAIGWLNLGWLKRYLPLSAVVGGGLFLAGLMLIPYRPYFFNYFNPLLGGSLTAPRLVSVGWGEGLDEAGRWLDAQARPESSRTGSWYASSLAPYYRGDIADVTGHNLDYLVLYLKQIQSGRPMPEVAQYFLQQPPLYTVRLAGMEYARTYPGPAAQPAENEAVEAGWVAYRPHTDYAPIGQELVVDLIGSEETAFSTSGPTLSIRWQGVTMSRADEGRLAFEGLPSVRRYRLPVPADLPPGDVQLYADAHRLGSLPAIRVEIPGYFSAEDVDFGDQVRLAGFNPRVPLEGNSLRVDLAWGANPKAWADYTVYVHLITSDGERLAGHDAQPEPPTSRWLKDQVVYDTHLIPLPDDLSPAETYHVRVGLYQADNLEPLGEPYVLPVEVKVP